MSNFPQGEEKLLFIGGGNIANAVACGLVNSGSVDAKRVSVFDIDSSKLDKFKTLGISTGTDIKALCADAKFIFLAVKPNIVRSVMQQLSQIEGLLERAVVISFAAAVPISFIENAAGRKTAIIRTMPSTPILVGCGVVAAAQNELVSKKDFEHICRMLSSIAYVTAVEEKELNPIISVHGSSPAYVYLFIKAMLDGAEAQGIDRKTALPLILKTVVGSVKMIECSGESIEKLIANVASPNGTTLAALNSFEESGFEQSVVKAMEACTKRADEISSEL